MSDLMAAKEDDSLLAVTLYYNKFSSPSRKILIALYEKKVDFTPRQIDLANKEQHERWFLKINPRGEVPVLQHGEKIITESTRILEYIGGNFGESGRRDTLFPRFPPQLIGKVEKFVKLVDAVPLFPLTYGCVLYHAQHVTQTLRYPYSDEAVTAKYRSLIAGMPESLANRALQVSDMEAGKVLAEKAAASSKVWPILHDLELYKALLAQVEALLDEVEGELGSADHLGPWLCGPTLTAADISLTCLLFRLHQIGLDDKFWRGGVRPCVTIYADMAFKRPSVDKATEFSLHKHESLSLATSGGGDSQLTSAYIGLGAAIALGAVYAYKKIKR